MEKLWYYSYDPETFVYTGMVLAETKPANATLSAIGDITNPVYDAKNDVWTGQSVSDYLKQLSEQATENASRPTALDMISDLSAQFAKTTAQSLLTQATLAKQLASAMVQITTLQAQVAQLTPKEGE